MQLMDNVQCYRYTIKIGLVHTLNVLQTTIYY